MVERFVNKLCDYFFDWVILIANTTYQQAQNQTIQADLQVKEKNEREGNSGKKRLRNEGGNFKKFKRVNMTQSARPKGLIG